ncbi:MAG TPA: DUF4250 domain-containing protein [Succinivibrionaceae bacterium]|nr:DUF4250 domain-containing protein [Succinivibrionaceae bacterium]
MIPIKRFATMDPYILVSAVNMQLRDEFSSLEDLCAAQEIDVNALKERLKKSGFKYDQEQRQFK